VVIKPGVDPSQWTPKQIEDARLRSLGPRFFPGTQAPPAGPTWYAPSPNDHVYFDEATDQWIEKNPYREIYSTTTELRSKNNGCFQSRPRH
jgi:hypothetical protein